MHTTGKTFHKICLKAIRDWKFSFQYVVCDQERYKGTRFLSGGDIQQKGEVQIFGFAGRPRPQSPPSVGHPDLPVRKSLIRVPGLLTAMILK